MSENLYIAVSQVEQLISGTRVYTNPGHPVRGLSEKDAEFLLARNAIRKPTEAEAKLEALTRAAEAKPTGRRRPAAQAAPADDKGGSKDEPKDESKDDESEDDDEETGI